MDSIICTGLTFSGCHGVLSEEKKHPQPFIIDLQLFLNLQPAGLNDDLDLTVDYARVFAEVQQLVENKSYNLIETLAENIAAALLQRFPVEAVEVSVYKPNAPVKGKFGHFAVKIKRFRK
jgi:dihydroneopterin aldolase